jgi:hypothetical protein
VVEEEVVVAAAVEEGSWTLALAFEGAGADSFEAGSVVPCEGGGVLCASGASLVARRCVLACAFAIVRAFS